MPDATLRPYVPTIRDRLNMMLSGEHPSWLRQHIADGITGRSGKSAGLLDFTPAGVALNGYEAGRSLAQGNYGQAALSGLAATPNAFIGKAVSGLGKLSKAAPIMEEGADALSATGLPLQSSQEATAPLTQADSAAMMDAIGRSAAPMTNRRDFLKGGAAVAAIAPLITHEALTSMVKAPEVAAQVATPNATAIATASKPPWILRLTDDNVQMRFNSAKEAQDYLRNYLNPMGTPRGERVPGRWGVTHGLSSSGGKIYEHGADGELNGVLYHENDTDDVNGAFGDHPHDELDPYTYYSHPPSGTGPQPFQTLNPPSELTGWQKVDAPLPVTLDQDEPPLIKAP